jgi:hypothetical protein
VAKIKAKKQIARKASSLKINTSKKLNERIKKGITIKNWSIRNILISDQLEK